MKCYRGKIQQPETTSGQSIVRSYDDVVLSLRKLLRKMLKKLGGSLIRLNKLLLPKSLVKTGGTKLFNQILA